MKHRSRRATLRVSKSLVALALAATPLQALADDAPPITRFDLDNGLSIKSADGAVGMSAGVVTQVRYDLRMQTSGDLSQHEALVRAVRPQLRAFALVPWLRLFVQPELAGKTPRLLDLELEAQPVDAFGVKVGQMNTPFTRAFNVPFPRLSMPDFSVANDAFRLDRDTGAMLFGHPVDGRVEWYGGVFNGNGINQGGNDNRRFAYIGRVASTPVGKAPKTTGHVVYDENPYLSGAVPFTLALGANAAYDEVTGTKDVVDLDRRVVVTQPRPLDSRTTMAGDVALQYDRLSFMIEGYSRRSLSDGKVVRSLGGFGQLGVFVVGRVVELTLRESAIRPDAGTTSRDFTETEVGATVYAAAHKAKLMLRYLHANARDAGVVSALPKGVTNGATIQAQLAL